MKVRVIQLECDILLLNTLEQTANKIISSVMFSDVDQIFTQDVPFFWKQNKQVRVLKSSLSTKLLQPILIDRVNANSLAKKNLDQKKLITDEFFNKASQCKSTT